MSLRHLLGTIVLTTTLALGFSGLAFAGEEGDETPESSTGEESQPPAKSSPPDDASDDAKSDTAEETDEASE